MYIYNVKIKNFRVIKDLDLTFDKGLNVLIGENNTGKTSVIDALRLVFEESNYPKNIYWKESDFRVNPDGDIKPIQIDIKFKIDEEIENAWFSELYTIYKINEEETEEFLELHAKIELINKKGINKVKRKIWGGNNNQNRITPEVLSSLNVVYLNALRDANRSLKLNRNNILTNLYNNIVTTFNPHDVEKYKDDLIDLVKEGLSDNKWEDFLNTGVSQINTHFSKMQIADNYQEINVCFDTFNFDNLLNKLTIQIPIYDSNDNEIYQNLDISQNGMGFNNLIYASTVLGDIIQRKEVFKEDYNLLLIEEPEAHLHPQLQNTFFEYLNELDTYNDFQLIVTSHSPTITAKTRLKNVIILQNVNNSILSTAIKDIPLDKKNLIYLEKFLDVTKSQLFFSKGVILVEGISEALLLPIFSKLMGEKYDLEKNGIEVLITGTSFEHFAKLFYSDDKNKRLNFKCAILTDDDVDPDTEKPLNRRLSNLEELKKEYAYNNLEIFKGAYTFESELYDINSEVCLKVLESIHPRTKKNFENETSQTNKDFVAKIKDYKSEFAYALLDELNGKNKDDNDLSNDYVPEYIQNAIKYVLGFT